MEVGVVTGHLGHIFVVDQAMATVSINGRATRL